jgi:excisionase family DNA binding protein
MLCLKAPMSTSNHVALDDWITPREAAERLGVSQQQARHLARTGVIQARKFGRAWMMLRVSVETYARSERHPGPKSLPSKAD